jgi:hypothetical protein
MSQTQPILERGRYAYSSHSLQLAGNIEDVFIGQWESPEGLAGRKLKRFDVSADVPNGQLMCVLKLRSPISIEDYKPVMHPAVRPVAKTVGAPIEYLLMDADVVCTFPDGM